MIQCFRNMSVGALLNRLADKAVENAQPKYAIQRWVEAQMYLFVEQARLLMRDHKKYGLFTAMLSLSDLTCITKGIRYPYYFCREIDDIVDGDRPTPNCFSSVQKMIESIKQ